MENNLFYNLSVEKILEPYIAKYPSDSKKVELENADFQNIYVDLTNRKTYNDVVTSLERYPNCAFFDQLDAQNAGKFAQRHTLLYMDFGRLLASPNGPNTTDDEKLRRKRYQWLIKQYLFEAGTTDINCGLFVTFWGVKEPIRFIPFDKSNSMARTCRMTFLRHDLKDGMNKRLMLGMTLESVALSKLYAYRGLYLSASRRIKNDDAFPLNEETVIVIPDKNTNITKLENGVRKNQKFKLITATKEEQLNSAGETVWKLKEDEKEISLNRFDGQGLICPEYATYISRMLRAESNIFSFQLRLPFGKGMLHTVDFHDLIKSHLSENTSYETIQIKDAFGFERNLSKAKIILTESMFKGKNWLKKYCEIISKEDPMQYYFEQFKEHGHALYISNVDTQLSNHGRTKLNYQFLNPMGFDVSEDKDALKSLVEKHFAYADRLKEDMLSQVVSFQEEFANDDSPYADEELLRYNEAPWAKVLQKNKAVIYDPKVKGMLRGCRQSRLRDTVFGRLSVKGECRFLARDLMALCWHVVQNCYTSDKKKLEATNKKLRSILAAVMNGNEFALPGSALPLKAGQEAVLLRNPHLSRNEEWLAAYYPGNALRKKYLSHLKGVLEIGYNSLANVAIGGADFDGDLVKVCVEDEIVAAVQNRQSHKAPIEIPDTGKPTEYTIKGDYTIQFDVIRRTFDSRIGQISNKAIKIGRWEYFTHKNRNGNVITPPNGFPSCAEACILTGIEIDSAKHGTKPDISKILSVRSPKTDVHEVDYLRSKSKIAAAGKFSPKAIKTSQGSYTITVSGKTVRIPATEKTAPNVDRLLTFYAKKLLQDQEDKKSAKKSSTVTNPFAVLCLSDSHSPDGSIGKTVKAIVAAYNRVLVQASRDYRAEQQYKTARYAEQIDTILQMQYDALTDKLQDYVELNNETVTVEEARNHAFNKIKETIDQYLLQKRVASEDDLVALSNDIQQTFLGWITAESWALATEEQQKDLLKEKFGFNETADDSAIALLTNFHCDGYKLLYFMVKDVVCEKYFSINALTDNGTKEENEEESIEPELSEEQNTEPAEEVKEDDTVDNAFLRNYLELYRQAQKEKKTKTIWQADLQTQARKDLFCAVGNDAAKPTEAQIHLAMCYVHNCGIDPNRNFFWDIFTPGEILFALEKTPISPEVTEDAQ